MAYDIIVIYVRGRGTERFGGGGGGGAGPVQPQ